MRNWQTWQFVLNAAKRGSMTDAARHMGIDATTVSRKIKRLEEEIGRQLFNRQGVTLKPTMYCQSLLPELEIAAHSMMRLNREALSTQNTFPHSVRISAVAMIIDHLLAPALPTLLSGKHLRVELVAEANNIILSRREADIAVRLAKPTTTAGIIRKAGRINLYPYIKEGVDPQSVLWATYTDEMVHLPETQWTRGQPDAKNGVHLAMHAQTLFEMVRTGAAKALLPHFLAKQHKNLVRIDSETAITREAWIITHREDNGVAHLEKSIAWIKEVFSSVH